jgi:methylaspartate ammonia-lyase
MIPMFAQSGEDRYANVDKMIMKNVRALPHGLINSPQLVGKDGETYFAISSMFFTVLGLLFGRAAGKKHSRKRG